VTGMPEVHVYPDGTELAIAAAARCVALLADAIFATGQAHLVLTGGGIGTKVLAAIASAPNRDTVDWSAVDFWWGDERFVPTGDPERNETGARAALLDVIGADPARVHPMAGPDGPDGDDPDAAAARYAAELTARAHADAQNAPHVPEGLGTGEIHAPTGPVAKGAEDGTYAGGRPAGRSAVPAFDVLMLGIGPEGHVASIFPEMPAAYDTGTVVAVRDSPKPPPTRISLTFPAIQAAREVWILASGAEKAEAVARALAGEPADKLPAAGARGLHRTLFLLDAPAGADIPTP
jgi:6-phosphogluconolactonase/glucosamine-6-phosphate isomerase/deaminase